jgi:hypothetical protein
VNSVASRLDPFPTVKASLYVNPTKVCGFPRESNLVRTLFPGYLSVVILLEGKEMHIFISTNGGKMGFSGGMGDWVGVSC